MKKQPNIQCSQRITDWIQIGPLKVIKKLNVLDENISTWLAESPEGQMIEVVTIQEGFAPNHLFERIMRNEICPLVNKEIPGVQKMLQAEFDSAIEAYYIAYEWIGEKFTPLNQAIPNLQQLKSLLFGLGELKKQNRWLNNINPETIWVNENTAKLKCIGLFEIFKNRGLINGDFTSPDVTSWIKDSSNPAPNFQSDIYSAFKSFERILESNHNSDLGNIFKKALSSSRDERFIQYSEIQDHLNNIKDATLINLSKRKVVKVITKPVDRERFSPILEDMNKGCHFLLYRELSRDKRQIMGRFTTNNYSGLFFVDSENHLFIPMPREPYSPDSKVLKNGFIAEFMFDYNPNGNRYNCTSFFEEEFEKHNKLTELNSTRGDLLSKWKTLPEKEREFIEETAFKANYINREESKSNPANIKFRLTDEFREWDKLKELKRNNVKLSIDDKIIGCVLNYNPNDCILIIKDAAVTVDEVPESGDLVQDVQRETSQFKKQIEAVKKFEKKDVSNPALCSILATPERISNANRLSITESDYESFSQNVINPNLNTDRTQKEAVFEALHYKPVYLIQGPPGTGKTTVIVELIQQIVKLKKDAKILITSQSNLAVDNVLERLPATITFMRLVAEEEKISSEKIKAHSFQSKLRNWVTETQKKSIDFFSTQFLAQTKDKALVSFFNFYANLSLEDDNRLSSFKSLLKLQNQYIKGLFVRASTMEEVETIFANKLGKDFQNFSRIQKDWFAFIANADSDNGDRKKSMLNDGSNEIDFRTAFAKSVNVIGATCIHIASGQYSKINLQFDYVIMDESSKASPAETLVPINMGQNIVLIGDHKQLPPVVTREEVVKQKVRDSLEDNGLDIEKEFGESLFEKLITSFEENPNLHSNIKMLDIQYRMPRQIGNLISRFFYNGKLKNPDLAVLPNFDKDKFHGLSFKNPTATIYDVNEQKEIQVPNSVVFVSTSGHQNSYDNDNKFDRRNECNKNAIRETLKSLNELYPDNLKRDKPFSIGVIAGYRGQVNLLKDSLNLTEYRNFQLKNQDGITESLIEINTVDKFQGAERDIIIYDIVKSSKGASPIGFLDDYRRINVAFSRVKRLLIIVGDSEYILKRAKLNPGSRFKEFKLKDIVQELERQNVIVKNLKDFIR